jgi:hypothetical protein
MKYTFWMMEVVEAMKVVSAVKLMIITMMKKAEE